MQTHRSAVSTTWYGIIAAGVAGLIAAVVFVASTQASNTANLMQVQASDEDELISAIEQANDDSGTPAEITLTSGATYQLIQPYPGTSTGLPRITSEITIVGNGAEITRSDPRGVVDFRIFRVNTTGDLRLENVAVTNGRVEGHGGGIANHGQLTILDSEVSGNEVFPDENGNSYGGGVYGDLRATTEISNSLIEDNEAVDGSGGGIFVAGLANIPTQLSLFDSTVRGNHADENGGGINSSASLNVSDSEIQNNTANEGGGGIYSQGQIEVRGSDITDNTARAGGGIRTIPTEAEPLFDNVMVEVVDSDLSGNSAIELAGGGIAHQLGGIRIATTTIQDNTAQMYGGGSSFGLGSDAHIEATTFSGNQTDGAGGAIMLLGSGTAFGELSLVNSTIHDNEADQLGGGLHVAVFGIAQVANTTITGNTTTSSFGGGGIGLTLDVVESDPGVIRLANTVVADNTATVHFADDIRSSDDAQIIDSGRNLVGNNATVEDDLVDGVNGNQVGTGNNPIDPELGPLQNNGGPTETRLPESTSPVIDAADPANAPSTDQRGVNRPIGDGPDIGAVERDTTGDPAPPPPDDDDDDSDTPGPPPSDDDDSDTSGLFNLPDNISVEAMSAAGSIVDYPAPSAADVDGSALAVNCDPASGSWFPVGQTTVHCSATDSDGQTHSGNFNVTVGTFDSLDISHADHIPNQFFERNWNRTDIVVRDGHATRTWLWGPGPFTDAMWEPYANPAGTEAGLLEQIPDSEREVIYFDKARMEINDPGGDPDSLWYVTNGLLVVEMITGERQFGDDLFIEYEPSHANIAGDADGLTGPTYASLADLMDAPMQTSGSLLTAEVDRFGSVTEDSSWANYNVQIAFEDDVTGHGIAEPFWEFMNSHGLVDDGGQLVEDALFENPFYATGRPVTGAYWANLQVGGEPRDVLNQCFERRCLTYTPGNPEGFIVEAGNVGQHYYDWRYIQAPD